MDECGRERGLESDNLWTVASVSPMVPISVPLVGAWMGAWKA